MNDDEDKLGENISETVGQLETAPNGNLGSYEAVDSEFTAGDDRHKISRCCPLFHTLRELRRPSETDTGHENCHLAPCSNTTTRRHHKDG